jgi:hypothetical protein
MRLWAEEDARRHDEDVEAWCDDRSELLPPEPWPPAAWGKHPRRCFTDHGLPDICRCGEGFDGR